MPASKLPRRTLTCHRARRSRAPRLRKRVQAWREVTPSGAQDSKMRGRPASSRAIGQPCMLIWIADTQLLPRGESSPPTLCVQTTRRRTISWATGRRIRLRDARRAERRTPGSGRFDAFAGGHVPASTGNRSARRKQINQAVTHIDTATQRNAALVEQVADRTLDEVPGGRFDFEGKSFKVVKRTRAGSQPLFFSPCRAPGAKIGLARWRGARHLVAALK